MKKDKPLKTGGDPRMLSDYVALRSEMSKLTHPARPDVDWLYAEKLCLLLFAHNGVELQTAAWYTLARTHIAGLAGMNEGLTLTGALMAHQWSVMWPGNIHARMEILAGLSQRLQNLLRTLVLNERNDLPLLYQAEENLSVLSQTLARHELKQTGLTEALLEQIGQATARLENAPRSEQRETGVVLPPQAVAALQTETLPEPERLVFVVQPEPVVDIAIAAPPAKQNTAKPFIAGVFTALFAGGLVLWVWNSQHRLSLTEPHQAASLTPLSAALPFEQFPASTLANADKWAEQTQIQLSGLMTLPPDWSLHYARTLLSQAKTRWPDSPAVAKMQQTWQQQLSTNALPLSALNSWHNGMSKLQQLTDRLNALDEKRGKYMTVSELKSEVFAIMQAFNRTIPVEEQLRLLAQTPTGQVLPLAQQAQTELLLRQLIARYSLLKQERPAIITLPDKQSTP